MNGDQFTKEALEQLSDSAPGVPVTMNFDHTKPIGKVLSSKVTDAGLEITVDLIKEIPGFCLCPGYRVPNYEAVSFGATTTPQDKTLPKFEIMKTNEDEKTEEQKLAEEVMIWMPKISAGIALEYHYDGTYCKKHTGEITDVDCLIRMIRNGREIRIKQAAFPDAPDGEKVNPLKGLKVRRGQSDFMLGMV